MHLKGFKGSLKVSLNAFKFIQRPNWRFPDMRRCAIGGFRPVESESELKNAKIGQLEPKNLEKRLSGTYLSGPVFAWFGWSWWWFWWSWRWFL